MAVVIGEVINEAQAGFIPGKHIGDNILLATELIKGYSQKAVSPRCMIKVDLRKAYDSIEWSFLQCMLSELGFPSQFITWIMECVTTVSYSILLNGKPTTPFPSKKGVRQVTPCHPSCLLLGWSICLDAY
ncbi:orf129a (mitochondrion) [Beta vulgaris subsp. vulgaris]|uniref:Orf129a protein n=1 Tax=Beta vulgaris subsp. vulgaris TaxID=3555 RepID=Q9MFE9_BETVV|nr:orf129a [Beta vulgaris subsp. vulgaris]BAA99293.1 orf129a [Beta vulgaris subsp. vulgaris]